MDVTGKTKEAVVRWGIIGCGGIARRMAAVIRQTGGGRLEAVASRDGERARAFAADFGAPKAYEGYDALLADRDVDAVYVATIHPAHAAVVRDCLLAGKPVLCEKPLTMTAAEAAALFQLAEEKGLLLMEAMWSRYLPACREAKALAESGGLGELRGASIDFSSYFPYDPAHRIYDPAKGGGALLDIGVYAIHMAFSIFGPDYISTRVSGRLAPTGVDEFAVLTLEYPQERTVVLTGGSDRMGTMSAVLNGRDGWLELPYFFQATEFTAHIVGRPDETRRFAEIDGFTYEVEEFHRLLCRGEIESAVVPHRDTIAALRLIGWAMDELKKDGIRKETGPQC